MNPLILYGIAFIALLALMGGGIAAFLSRTAPGENAPVTAASVLDALDEGAIVLGPDDTVLMANVTFRSLFADEPVGEPLETVLESHPNVLEATTGIPEDGQADTGGRGSDEATTATVTLERQGGDRRLTVENVPIGSGIHEDRKRLVRIEDVTDNEV